MTDSEQLETQAETIAKIAGGMDWDLTDTAKCIRYFFNALNHAYRAGFAAGSAVTLKHHQQTQEVIERLFK